MEPFALGGGTWHAEAVPPESLHLMDADGIQRLGMTDVGNRMVYVSDALAGYEAQVVLTHEVAHCVMEEFGLREEIRSMALPECRDAAEEWACNLVADYGLAIMDAAYDLMGRLAWKEVPKALGRLGK